MGILYNATAVGKARNGVWHAFVEVLQIQWLCYVNFIRNRSLACVLYLSIRIVLAVRLPQGTSYLLCSFYASTHRMNACCVQNEKTPKIRSLTLPSTVRSKHSLAVAVKSGSQLCSSRLSGTDFVVQFPFQYGSNHSTLLDKL